MSNHIPKLITVLGPTASGKTDLGIALAKEHNGEIISADSRQIYKEMNIGTGKTDALASPRAHQEASLYLEYTTTDGTEFTLPIFEVEFIAHYLFNVVNPDQDFTVAHFKEITEYFIKDIHSRNKTPLVVGGTGLYISSVVDNLTIPQAEPDTTFRENQESRIKNREITIEELYKELVLLDPDAARFVEPHNPRRIIRALEVMHTTGKKLSELRSKGPKKYDVLQIGINVPQEELEKRINNRVETMINTGLVDEVKMLVKRYPSNRTALSGIGYREIIEHLNGNISLEEACNLIKLHTRQFAKRQIKWFKRDKTIQWTNDYSEAVKLVKGHLQPIQ